MAKSRRQYYVPVYFRFYTCTVHFEIYKMFEKKGYSNIMKMASGVLNALLEFFNKNINCQINFLICKFYLQREHNKTC